MSKENDFVHRVIAIARSMGLECKCRKMRRVAVAGEEYFEPYSEYEVRRNGRLVILDEGMENAEPDIANTIIERELEHLRIKTYTITGTGSR